MSHRTETTNTFSFSEEGSPSTNETNTIKTKLPPIFVTGVEGIYSLITLLNEEAINYLTIA